MNSVEVLNKLHDFVSKPVLFIAFGLLLAIFAFASFVLLFHWRRYAIDKSAVIAAQSLFFLGGAFILLLGFLSVILY